MKSSLELDEWEKIEAERKIRVVKEIANIASIFKNEFKESDKIPNEDVPELKKELSNQGIKSVDEKLNDILKIQSEVKSSVKTIEKQTKKKTIIDIIIDETTKTSTRFLLLVLFILILGALGLGWLIPSISSFF